MKIKKSKKGISLIETLVSIVLLTIIGIVSTQMLLNSQRIYNNIDMLNTLKSNDQQGINTLTRDITTAKVFIARNPTEAPGSTTSYSSYYLNRLSINGNLMSSTPTPVVLGSDTVTAASARVLAKAVDNLSFSPDNTTSFQADAVGNSLMIGTYEDNYTYSWDATVPDPVLGLPSTIVVKKYRTLDILQLHYFYLADMSGSVVKNMQALIKWSSKYYVDQSQLQQLLSDTTMTNTIRNDLMGKLSALQLVTDSKSKINLEGAWKYSEKRDIAAGVDRFYKLTYTAATALLDPVLSTYKIPMLTLKYVMRDKMTSGISYGITKNITADEAPNPNLVVPKFATATTGFPNGLEIMVSGSGGSKSVFIRTVTVANTPGKKMYNETTGLAQGKDS